MDLLKVVYEMKETVGQKLAQANKKIKANGGEIGNDDMEMVDELTHSLKSLITACAMLEAEENGGGYSERYSGGYSGMPMWNPGITYGYAGRESREGYSRAGGGSSGGYSRNRYSRENWNGYSRAGDMTDQLRQMMDEAPDEMTRMEIKKLMDRMENQR